LTGITKTFVPFYSSFPEIFHNFVMFLMNKLAGVSASQLLTPAVKNI
jgi:hypothetical protein